MKKIAIIGSGVAGLASGVRLALKGYKVHIFEQNKYPGGKLSSFKLKGYRFDAGPSLFTMPHFISELFELAGENTSDHFHFKKKDVSCKYFWQDGKTFTAFGNQEKFLDEVELRFNEPRERVMRYLKKAKKKYDLTGTLFLEKSLHKIRTFFTASTIKAILQLHVFEIQKSLHQVNSSAFSSPYLIQLFDRYATYNGSDPYQTPGIMSLIQHFENSYGTFIPTKGMVSITEALVALAKRLGVKFHFGSLVNQIVLNKKSVKGIMVSDDFFESDYVISNMDVFYTYKKLIPKSKPPLKVLNQERSSSAIIFYWGIKHSFKQLDLHNIFFSKNYSKEFESIFKNKTICTDPTIYVNITSKDVYNDAPEGCENWFVMVNTPSNHGQDWNKLVKNLREIVINNLSEKLGISLEDKIECEEILTPPTIESKTQSHMGALYGSSSNKKIAAFLRHPNFSNKIKNLYFCGGSVHPGGGIPLCLLSAKIVSEIIPDNTK